VLRIFPLRHGYSLYVVHHMIVKEATREKVAQPLVRLKKPEVQTLEKIIINLMIGYVEKYGSHVYL